MFETPILSVLRDIYMPGDVSWWPLAPGWWILMLLAILLIALLIRQWYRGNLLRHEAMSELARISSEFETHQQHNRITMEINILLRRVALAKSPKTVVAGLIGSDWLKFLDKRGGDGEFSNGPGKVLGVAPYLREVEVDINALIKLAKRWIKRNL